MPGVLSFRQERGEETSGYKRKKRGGGVSRHLKVGENKTECVCIWGGLKREELFQFYCKNFNSILNFIDGQHIHCECCEIPKRELVY